MTKKTYIVVDTMYNDGYWLCDTKKEVMESCGEDGDMDWKEFIQTTEYRILKVEGDMWFIN